MEQQKRKPDAVTFRPDLDLVIHLSRIPNRSLYINELIRKDMLFKKSPLESIKQAMKEKVKLAKEMERLDEKIRYAELYLKEHEHNLVEEYKDQGKQEGVKEHILEK